MATASDRPPIFEGGVLGGCFRSRSGDADWDFFPLRRWGRGYRVSEDEMARLQRIERRVLVIAVITGLGASAVLGVRLSPPAAGHFAFYGVWLAILLASKLAYDAVAAWFIRHNHVPERPFARADLESWAELRRPRTARLSLPRNLVAIVIAAATIAVGAFVFCRTMDVIDVERRWLGMIGGLVLAAIGLSWAYGSFVVLCRHLSQPRPQQH